MERAAAAAAEVNTCVRTVRLDDGDLQQRAHAVGHMAQDVKLDDRVDIWSCAPAHGDELCMVNDGTSEWMMSERMCAPSRGGIWSTWK